MFHHVAYPQKNERNSTDLRLLMKLTHLAVSDRKVESDTFFFFLTKLRTSVAQQTIFLSVFVSSKLTTEAETQRRNKESHRLSLLSMLQPICYPPGEMG